MRYSPTLRFTVFGAISYTVFSMVGVLISLRSVARYVQFTDGERWLTPILVSTLFLRW